MVKRHKWIDGILQSYNHIFESFSEAKSFAETSDADTVKVYDEHGQLVHETKPSQNSYA